MNSWVEDWLNTVCESNKTLESYVNQIEAFASFSATRGLNFEGIVEDWRRVKRLGEAEREDFLDKWSDTVRGFNSYLKRKGLAPLTIKNFMATLKSFFRFWDIPINISLPKRACVIYHNRDLTREEIRQILTFASPRDRVIWLIMAESGMRAETAINLRYWQIKEDFEAKPKRIPMRIILPSESLKDHVGDRFTFIGEDGVRELSEYLSRRLPLKDEDYVFASEKAGKVKGEQFSVASLSVKFNRLVQKLGIDTSKGGKPKSVRMHALRKYFRNNMKADSSFVRFWMGHSLGVDAHYITRDVERHRQEYAKGYEYLRIFEPSAVSVTEILEQLRRKDEETKALKQEIAELRQRLEALTPEYRLREEILKILREMGLTVKQ
jgi:integrase